MKLRFPALPEAASLADMLPIGAARRSLIELRGVGKRFRVEAVETIALASIDLAIGRGELVSINGPSGSGKSTLLAILGLLDTPSHGVYRLEGLDTATLAPTELATLRNKTIGFIFQSFNLIADLSVELNVELPLIYGGVPPARRKERVAEALELVKLSHLARQMPGRLSGGQQQRVAVARAIADNPPILLADEPTGNLDSRHGDDVIELLCALHARGATVCLVTHNPAYARVATRILHMADGRIVEDARTALQ
jgi:putative ABC transport system ATP-binding protein